MSEIEQPDTAESVERLLSGKPRVLVPGLAAAAVVAAGVGMYLLGAAPRRAAAEGATERAAAATAPVRRVQAATVRLSDERVTVRQSASLEPNRRAAIFSQVGGYLAERRVDVGDRVIEGQVLGVVATPLIEKELSAALSQRAVVEAELADNRERLDLANRSLARLNEAARSQAAAAQDVDNAEIEVRRLRAAVTRAEAVIDATNAQINRIQRQLEFRELKAPFAGQVTRRTREQGDYIEFGGNPNDPPIFTVLDTSTLRTVIAVPQAQAYLVQVGQAATVRVSGMAGAAINAKVSRVSAEIDPVTRTMPVEVEVPNADGRLLAGSFATVEISTVRPAGDRPAMIPGNALMMLPTQPDGGGGPTVGVLVGEKPPHALEYRSVKLGRDFGSEVEVLGGVKAGERVVLNLPVPLGAEIRVEPVAAATAGATGAGGAGGQPPAGGGGGGSGGNAGGKGGGGRS